MLLTSHLENLHNVTDLKMHGEEDPLPFSVANHCGISMAWLLLAAQLFLLRLDVDSEDWKDCDRTLSSVDSITDVSTISPWIRNFSVLFQHPTYNIDSRKAFTWSLNYINFLIPLLKTNTK